MTGGNFSKSLISDTSVSKHLKAMPGATPRPLECIKFPAMVWMSAKQSQKLDNVALCSSDIGSKGGFSKLDYQGPIDGDRRLWFVNLAAPAK